jgi:hypothetical protein
VIQKEHIAIERLVLPLAADGHGVDMLLGITQLNPASPRRKEASRA